MADVSAALRPLDDHERPTPLLVAVVVSVALALAVLVSVLTVHNLSRHGGSLPGGLFLAGVLFLLARGMWERRYWAVLSFEALLAFQIIVTSLALVVAETLLAAGSVRAVDRACGLAVLEARARDGADSGRRAHREGGRGVDRRSVSLAPAPAASGLYAGVR